MGRSSLAERLLTTTLRSIEVGFGSKETARKQLTPSASQMTMLVFFSFIGGLAAPFWRMVNRAVTARTGRSSLGSIVHFLFILLCILPLFFAERSLDLKSVSIAFFVGAILGCGIREWGEGTSRLDILIASGAFIFLLSLSLYVIG